MNYRDEIITALIVSVGLHVLLFFGATHVRLQGAPENKTPERKNFQIQKLHVDIPERKAFETQPIDYTERIKFEQPAEMDLAKKEFDKFETGKNDPVLEEYDAKIEELFASRNQEIKRDPAQYFRDLSGLKRKPAVKTNAPIIEISQLTVENTAVEPGQVIDQRIEPEEFYEKMPGFTPKWNPQVKDFKSAETSGVIHGDFKPLVSKKSRFTDLKEYLVSEVLTYTDPKTKEKYFQINMKVGKDAAELKTITKEVVFLIDCSKSTTEKRFREFKEGLEYSLSNLNPGDTFNILAFKKFIVEFKPQSVVPNAENVRQALRFVDELTLGTRTDAYNALLSSISRPINRNPSYIIFLSDGYPTQGVTEPSRIIHEVSELNNGLRSIFAFSGGLNVNRYLLDFITYKNRGWSEYSYRSHQIGQYLGNMYDKIKEPVLVNLRYHVSGLAEQDIYPKLLPDFFRNIEFTLYGKYSDEDDFVLQLVGNVEGKVTEFVIESSLHEAAEGTQDIAKNWAFNKIYELIGQLREGEDNTQLIEQIRALSKRYKIRTPYLD
ncbi:MAG: VWA domain-containing protein [Candidatus Omnitrophica bacterium]|nr:VWA domain-containing protein [Candidatus Omnitrophota bacterium]